MNDLNRFIDVLPQQYPFRMIDEIVEYEEGKSLTAVKNITGNEWVFEGMEPGSVKHFPETLIIEAAAQTALMYYFMNEKPERHGNFFLGKISAEFSEQANIGDRLVFKTDKYKKMGNSGFMEVNCFMDDKSFGQVQIFYGLVG